MLMARRSVSARADLGAVGSIAKRLLFFLRALCCALPSLRLNRAADMSADYALSLNRAIRNAQTPTTTRGAWPDAGTRGVPTVVVADSADLLWCGTPFKVLREGGAAESIIKLQRASALAAAAAGSWVP